MEHLNMICTSLRPIHSLVLNVLLRQLEVDMSDLIQTFMQMEKFVFHCSEHGEEQLLKTGIQKFLHVFKS